MDTYSYPDFFASQPDYTHYMDDSSFSDSVALPSVFNTWRPPADRPAPAWQVVLVDRQGRPAERPGARPAPDDADAGLPVAVLRDAQRWTLFAEALRAGRVAILPEPWEGHERLWVVVPVQTQGRALGAVLVGGVPRDEQALADQAAPLHEAGRQLLTFATGIGDLYALAEGGDNALQARVAAQMERTAALQQVSALVIATREVDVISRTVLLEVRRLFVADRAAIFLLQPDGSLRCTAALGLAPDYIEAVNQFYTRSAGGRAMTTLDIVYVADAQNDAVMGPMQAIAAAEGYRSLIIVPFVSRGEPIGALTLYHDQQHAYSVDDTLALTTFANQVAIAIDNAHLFEEAQRQLARLTFLTEVGRMLNSTLELNALLAIIAQAGARLIGGSCALYLPRPEDESLELRTYYDQVADQRLRRQSYLDSHRPVAGGGPIGEAVTTRTPRLITLETAPQDDPYLAPIGSHAYLALPLRLQERVTGVLVLWLFNPDREFTPDDSTLAEALADRAAVVLENARLYEGERQAQRAKDDFLSAVSHELRTPLTAIIGYTQLLRKRVGNDPAHEQMAQHLQIIRSQADRLHRLIETILDISRIEKGQFSLQAEELDLVPLLREVLERIQAAGRPTLRYDVQIADDICRVWGDRVRLEQVFSHLLSNAVKYSPSDGVIRIYMMQIEDQIHVDISDQGPGVRSLEAEQLFERYYKADIPLNRAGGLGLGLYVSRAIIEAHGGTISVQTAPGAGALFRVTLRCLQIA